MNKTINNFFRDKNGKLATLQPPNLPLLIWFMSMITSNFIDGTIDSGLKMLAGAALFTWAYLEIVSGDSPFRKMLGGAVMLVVLSNFFL